MRALGAALDPRIVVIKSKCPGTSLRRSFVQALAETGPSTVVQASCIIGLSAKRDREAYAGGTMANFGQHEFYEYWILEVGPIWVRSEPCHEKGERVGHEKQGTYVASARRVGNWVELVGRYRDADNRPCGGWMMVDGRDKGLGLLLRRLDGAEAVAAKLQQVKRDALASSSSVPCAT